MALFDGWFDTDYYALLYRHRNEEDAEAMVGPIMDKARLRPGQALLDMGCGRGRHAALFARKGLRVTGIDLSEASIRKAAELAPNARFEVFDIRKPYATEAFDAVVCLFTSLGYSGNLEDDEAAVSAGAQALKKGGVFVLDLMNGELVARQLVPKEERTVEQVHFTIQRCMEGDDVVKRITVDTDGAQKEFEERVHAWKYAEIMAMVAKAGLVVEDVTDGTCTEPFDPEHSGRIVVWARKKP